MEGRGLPVEDKIISFIRKHHVLTLATVADGVPWCANMFYAYMPAENLFVFTSDDNTRHASEFIENDMAAASIVLETKVVGKVQGLQISGRVRRVGVSEGDVRCKKAYIKKFPYAAAVPLNLWVLEPTYYKLTDNTLGFGKKIVWQSQTIDK